MEPSLESAAPRTAGIGGAAVNAGGLLRPVTIGPLTLPGNLFLAPVAGYTDRAFRTICRNWGADFTYTELISAEAIVRHKGPLRESKSWPLLRRGEGERPYGIQLFGDRPELIYEAALRLAELEPDLLDINCGCPVPKVVKAGAGSALMRDPAKLGAIVTSAVKASGEALGNAPVTVKIRSGWDSLSLNYREVAEAAVDGGAAMVTLHPRTRAQGYGGKSDWSLIGDLASRLPIPVAGSGDLFAPEDAERALRETGCAAVMFARGAMGNPFIFTETRRLLLKGSAGGESSQEAPFPRLATAFSHLQMLAEDLGERIACREMRKQFCAYAKGLPGGARLRERFVRGETVEEYRNILEDVDLEAQ